MLTRLEGAVVEFNQSTGYLFVRYFGSVQSFKLSPAELGIYLAFKAAVDEQRDLEHRGSDQTRASRAAIASNRVRRAAAGAD